MTLPEDTYEIEEDNVLKDLFLSYPYFKNPHYFINFSFAYNSKNLGIKYNSLNLSTTINQNYIYKELEKIDGEEELFFPIFWENKITNELLHFGYLKYSEDP